MLRADKALDKMRSEQEKQESKDEAQGEAVKILAGGANATNFAQVKHEGKRTMVAQKVLNMLNNM